MAALNIPGIGERIGPRYQRVVTFGASGESPDVSFSTSTGDFALINVNEPNVFVHKIEAQNIVALDTTAITVGDTSDADGFWTDTLLGHTTSAVFNSPATTVGYAAGKLYTSSQAINVNIATAAPTTGKIKFRVEYSRGVDTDLAPATSS